MTSQTVRAIDRAVHRPVRADHAAGGHRRRHASTGPASSRCSPAGCRPAGGTGWSPAPADWSRRSPSSRFGDDELAAAASHFWTAATLDYLAAYRFDGDIDGYPEGELYFPGLAGADASRGSFGAAVILETLALSILNHDCAIASAAARMAVRGR